MAHPHQPSPEREFFEVTAKRQIEIYNEFLEDLFKAKSPESSAVFPFIRSKLDQFDLWPSYDETAILQEVYFRTVAKIREGRILTNPSAWTCSVAFRYIRELSRCKQRYTHTNDEHIESLIAGEDDNHEYLTDQMLRVRDAFRRLPLEERLILSLKVVENKSWTEIQAFLKEKGYGDYKIPALRKRKERVLSKLRGFFHALEVK